MNQRDFEIVEIRDYERYRSEAEAALGTSATSIVVETSILDASNGSGIFEGIRASILANPTGRWVLDFSKVRFIDSAAMTALVHLVSDSRLEGRLTVTGAGIGLKRRWPSIFDSNANVDEAASGKGGR